MDKTTSDEKLLKLIEGSSGLRPNQKIGVKQKGRGFLPLPLKFKFPTLKHYLNFRSINKGLYLICGLLTLVFLFTIINDGSAVRADLIFPSTKPGGKLAKLVNRNDNIFLGLDEYQQEIKNRNIFLAVGLKGSSQEELGHDLSQMAQDLKLVGVIWSNNPEVMIESTKENRTYLLKKGDTVSQFKIKDITRSSAILETEVEGKAEEYELR